MKQTCEFITYTSPSDSYDIPCGAKACDVFERKHVCKKHLTFLRQQVRNARDKEQKELNERYSGLE